MFTRAIDWVKEHKAASVLLIIALYVAFRLSGFFIEEPIGLMPQTAPSKVTRTSMGVASDSFAPGAAESSFYAPTMPYDPDFAPNANITNRMVVQNSYLSLLVTNVVDVRKKILSYTTEVGGYMVNAETANPQDAPTSTITVRIPSEKLDVALENFRSWGVKVVSENLQGYDITDQFVDIEARIATLETTKNSMEALLRQATEVSDLTNLTREVINIQSQIDGLKGSQKSLSENAKLAKVTIYLSTDEIALPYAPTETFRPEVILKLAVRSLVTHLRQFGALAIWIGVYAVIWIPLLVIAYLINKRITKK